MIGWALFIVTILIVFLLGLLASTIIERRVETVYVGKPRIEISEYEPRNEVWGKAYPREYETYSQMADTTFRSMFHGSAMIDALEFDPRMVVLWAGYGFSKDYTQARGHFYAVTDIRETLRTGGPMEPEQGPMPSTCWTCKSPDVPRIMREIGAEDFYDGPWAEMGPQIVNPIGCADCHDPITMDLRISRPALIEAFNRRGRDISNAPLQEMRTLVCAQCHVEYYFKGSGQYLTYPWDYGFNVEDMEKYYDDLQFSDWEHQISKAPMVKAQHPGYEIFMTGIHAQRGVACADCHMPFKSEGGQKFTDHKIQSPLNNINASCQVCHRESEDELKRNVYERQMKVAEQRFRLEDNLVMAHIEAGIAWEEGATEEAMEPVLKHIRHAQWRWDFAVASHGASFHSPLEIMRIISSAMERVQEARIILARILAKSGSDREIEYPDLSTKAKAQAYIGLEMEELNREKVRFLEEVIPRWEEQAEIREQKYRQY
ncbi:MAG: ammonia-forming cytochrome c nitrite reductase [Cyclobacteriaceae bacterium]|nr:ammonia-forming cytochrome c nitrite reductase [Cyclobacteriaceae bacterium]